MLCLGQTWNTGTESHAPLNYAFGFNAGGFIDEDGKLRMYVAGGQSRESRIPRRTLQRVRRGAT
jgi:hypothetical protein